jgi:hypothetical protein
MNTAKRSSGSGPEQDLRRQARSERGDDAAGAVPGVEHAEKSNLGSQVAGIASDLKQGFSAGMKQEVIDQSLVLQGQRREFPRQRENDLDVTGGQEFLFTGFEPADAGVALTFWAMPISARVVRDDGMSAVRALIAMSTQRSGTAARDG